jgi:EmrB/QacA subfamily drug resistance transporter
MADRFGTRRVFCIAIGVFTIGSVLCGRADSLAFLIASRVVQGAGGAMMLPVGRLVLLRTVPANRLISAMAWVTMPALIGPVLGPPVGGLILKYLSWRWIFDINVPIGVAGIALALAYIPDRREPDPGPFDLPGLLLSGVALAAFLAVLELVGRDMVPAWSLGCMAAAGVASGWAYLRHARRQARPLLDFSLLRLPTFAVSVFAGSLFRVGVGATPFLLPMMMQVGFGRSALQSGLVTFAAAAGAMVAKPGSQAILRHFGFRTTLAVNGVLCGLGMAAYGAFRPDWPLPAMYTVLLATGYLRSLQFTSYNSVAYADVPAARMSAATTLYAALQQVSLTIGIPIGAFVLHLARGGQTAPTPAAFSLAFLVVAAISVLGGPLSLLMPRGAGRVMSGSKR